MPNSNWTIKFTVTDLVCCMAASYRHHFVNSERGTSKGENVSVSHHFSHWQIVEIKHRTIHSQKYGFGGNFRVLCVSCSLLFDYKFSVNSHVLGWDSVEPFHLGHLVNCIPVANWERNTYRRQSATTIKKDNEKREKRTAEKETILKRMRNAKRTHSGNMWTKDLFLFISSPLFSSFPCFAKPMPRLYFQFWPNVRERFALRKIPLVLCRAYTIAL